MNFLDEVIKKIVPIDKNRIIEKEKELNSLLKIPKGLGRLEELAIQLEGIQKNYEPNKKIMLVMASDNGVESENVSKSKKVITQYVVEAMLNGKSSINALANTFGVDVRVVDLGIEERTDIKNEISLNGVINNKLMEYGTNNIAQGPAMDYNIAKKAIEDSIKIVDRFVEEGYNIFATGEMGIGNTTTSSALLKVFTDLPLDDIVGYGSGIDDNGLIHKKNIIQKSIEINSKINKFDKNNPIDVLAKVGGLDIAGMVGVYLGCAKNKIPVIIDGFISGVAALISYKICPNSRDYMIPSHICEEPGMRYVLKELELEPMLYLKMQLGEGSGAVMMFPVIDSALNITKTVRKYPEV